MRPPPVPAPGTFVEDFAGALDPAVWEVGLYGFSPCGAAFTASGVAVEASALRLSIRKLPSGTVSSFFLMNPWTAVGWVPGMTILMNHWFGDPKAAGMFGWLGPLDQGRLPSRVDYDDVRSRP